MEQLSALDAAFVYLESERTPMHIGGVYLLDRAQAPEGFGFAAVAAHVRSRLRIARIYRQRLLEVPLALGHPYWVADGRFELEDHLPRHSLEPPGDKRSLMELAAEIFARPLERSRPLWEMAWVDGLDAYPGLAPGSCAIVVRVHHAAIDGLSGVEIMGALLDPTPEPFYDDTPDPWEPERVPSGLELAARSYAGLGRKSLRMARTLEKTAVGAARAAGTAMAGHREAPVLPLRAPRTPWNVPVSRRRTFGGVEIELDRVKRVRAALDGSTVNDVLLAVCSGALRRWLEARGALPTRSLVAMVPMSVRSAKTRGRLGNQVAALLVELATEHRDPADRLAGIHASSRAAKGYGRAVPAPDLMDLVPSETAALAGRLYTALRVSERHPPWFNLVITNVPGPPTPLYLAGARLRSHFGMAPVFDGMGLILVLFSFDGRLSVGISACREVLDDASELEQLLESSLAELEELPPGAANGRVPRGGRSRDVEALHAATERLGRAIEILGRDAAEEE